MINIQYFWTIFKKMIKMRKKCVIYATTGSGKSGRKIPYHCSPPPKAAGYPSGDFFGSTPAAEGGGNRHQLFMNKSLFKNHCCKKG
jgi:hypothetical protein